MTQQLTPIKGLSASYHSTSPSIHARCTESYIWPRWTSIDTVKSRSLSLPQHSERQSVTLQQSQIRSKRGTKDSETDVVVKIFDKLQKALESAPAANAPAADTARLEGVPLTSSGLRSKRGTKESETDAVVEIFHELQKALKAVPAADAAADLGRQEEIPHFFRPFQQKMRMSTGEGRASVIVSLQPKGSISLAFAADKMREVWGGEWPVAYLAYAQGHLHIRGTGVRRVDDLEIALSRDGEQWVVASPEAHQKQALWEGLLLRRRKDEGKSGRPWADEIWSYELEE
ncbi:hypothetical protein BCV69DRAFT_298513 [Microstroma glucosiphilum]|uniref:Uncharacterized protein n=1 Tax=Pseudomicrostroma glucosiphilum TaxID=1684307 RepID=A0A316U8L0_9BASI|nr:hypothetical protein BCV69DRAFT_298513 [Pseudomicrostroma glucosiphilum]PWN21502.1 hypothetical protein BCV69DRAFT_298513 [Pseudomicrostroma glucosiphilum]